MDHNNFKKAGSKPSNKFKEDQTAWLEDEFTSLMMWFENEERSNRKLKIKIASLLLQIRENTKNTEE